MHALVLNGGPLPALTPELDASAFDVVIAADSGLEWATLLGINADYVLGDFDSVDPIQLDVARQAGATVEAFPAAKDFTDFEAALRKALELGATEVTVVGGTGGRLDHLVANLSLLTHPDFATLIITAHFPPATVTPIWNTRNINGIAGDYLSLISLGHPVAGITTSGLEWELDNGHLEPGWSLGVSNVLVGSQAQISVGSGCLLAIQPGPS